MSATAPVLDLTGHAAPAPARAPQGRSLISVEPLCRNDGEAEMLATRICRLLGPAASGPGEGPDDLLTRHAAPGDLAHWAEVDAVRAGYAQAADLTICAHEITHESLVPAWRQVLVLDLPADSTGRVLAALHHGGASAGDGGGFGPGAVLTGAGWLPVPWPGTAGNGGREAASAVREAILGQAGRRAGRALVFPGQHRLQRDVTVAEILARTAIGAVTGPSGTPPPDGVVRCHGYARPGYRDGTLTLAVAFDNPLFSTAIEVRYSRPCCGEDH